MTQVLTYKYRLLPTKRQHAALRQILEDQRQLYNAALQERIDCHRKTGKTISFIDQTKSLTQCRRDLREMSIMPCALQRWTLKRLDDAYKSFFRRLKVSNGKAGFPRYRGQGRWSAFGFRQCQGISFNGKRIRFKGLSSSIRVHMHRPIPDDADIRSCVFRLDSKGWHICFQIAVEMAKKKTVETSVGLDVGLKVFAYQSDGVIIPNPRLARKAERQMRVKQRALARCKRGSNRRKKVKSQLRKLHTKIVNTRTTWMHQQSARIAKQYDLIAVEDLNIKNMAKHPTLAKSIHDAAWAKFQNMLEYKAERAGSHFIKVNPRGTSINCSSCGEPVPKSLAIRAHSCPSCGLEIDRDLNAALNILNAVVLDRGSHNVGGCVKRGTENITEVTK